MVGTENSKALIMDCYDKILKYFENIQERDRDEIRLWKTRALIKIMEFWENTKNDTLLRNSTILLISLFESIPPDIYNNRGVDINLLSNEDRKLLAEELKFEFEPEDSLSN